MKSFKSLLLLILLVFTALPCTAKIIYPTSSSSSEYSFTPDDTLFMFDVDRVLVMRFMDQPLSLSKMKDYWSMAWEMPNKFALIKIMPTFFRNYHLLKEQIKKYDGPRILKWLFAHYPELKTVQPYIEKFAAKAQPIQGTLDIIQSLKAQGFVVSIATNQGSRVFDQLVKSKILPELNPVVIFTPDFQYPFDQDGPEEGFIKKPQYEYYDNFKKAAVQTHTYTHFIFIDDKLSNVEAAAQQGIIGIHFTNPENLKKDLVELGFSL